MLNQLFQLAGETFRKRPATFAAPVSPQAAAARLAAETPPDGWFRFFRPEVVGEVTVDRVVLRWHQPFAMNVGGPAFRGYFVSHGGRTVLCGSFEQPRAVRAFATLWLAMGASFTVALPLIGAFGAAQQGMPWLLGLIAGGVMAGAGAVVTLSGAALLAYQRWQDRIDITEIERHVLSALAGDGDD